MESFTLQPIVVYFIYCNKVSQTGWLKQQKFIYAQFWRVEVWDEDANKVDFFYSLSPSL